MGGNRSDPQVQHDEADAPEEPELLGEALAISQKQPDQDENNDHEGDAEANPDSERELQKVGSNGVGLYLLYEDVPGLARVDLFLRLEQTLYVVGLSLDLMQGPGDAPGLVRRTGHVELGEGLHVLFVNLAVGL